MATSNSLKTRADALSDRLQAGISTASADAKDVWADLQEHWDSVTDRGEDFLADMEKRLDAVRKENKMKQK